jgi:hypothetical protein
MESFFTPGDFEDALYEIIRDDPREKQVRELIEELWSVYKHYADRQFLKKVKREFDQRIWEMYLACTFIRNKLPLERHKEKGPDLCLESGNSFIWIEAVVPTLGVGKDAVPEMEYGKEVATPVPEEQIMFRYRSVIEDKYKKYREYLRDHTLGVGDCYAIAVNGCKIEREHPELQKDIPKIIRCLFASGQKMVEFTLNRVVGPYYGYQNQIKKVSGSPVSTDIFLTEEYGGISAILFTCFDILHDTPLFGDDFIMARNPLARNKIPPGYIHFGREFWFDGSRLKYYDWCK